MSSSKKKIVILGAGVTGLSAAYKLCQNPNHEVILIDKAEVPGGLCRSFEQDGFILDHGPHKFYTLVEGITEELKDLMGDELLVRDKVQKLYLYGKYFSFPLKLSEMLLKFPPQKCFQILLGFVPQLLSKFSKAKETKSYEEFIIQRFGKGLYREIFEPLAKKIYGNPQHLDKKLAEVRISSPGLIAVLKQMLLPKEDKTISAPKFHYPKKGYGRIPERLAEEAKKRGAQFYLNTTIKNIILKDKKVSGVVIQKNSGETVQIDCDELIYTIAPTHLPQFIEELPSSLKSACAWTQFRHTVIYYFLLDSKPVLPAMWTFFPESKFRFGRLSEMCQFSPETSPRGKTALMVDFTCLDEDSAWNMDDTQLGEMLLKELEPLKLFKKTQVIKSFSKRFKNVYPIYSVGFQRGMDDLRKFEKEIGNIYFVGRLGDFNYNNADQCLDMGFQVAVQIQEEKETSAWQLLRQERFLQYKIVD